MSVDAPKRRDAALHGEALARYIHCPLKAEDPISSLADVNLNRLLIYVTVIEAGSFTAAAERLRLAKTMVSAHVQRLEQEIGASLLLRTTRSLRMTEAGEAFYESARQIVADAQAAIETAAQATQSPRGTLRVTAPIDYGATVLAPLAVTLQQRYPELHIELLTGDRVMDLVADNIDVAIRIGRLADSAHRAVRIGSFSDWLVASPALFDRHALPCTPQALAELPFIALSVLPQPATWLFTPRDAAQAPVEVRFRPKMSTNTAYALRTAAAAGGGLAILPDFVAAADVATGRLVRVLPDWQLPTGGVHAVFPATRHIPRKTRILIDAMKAQAEAESGLSPDRKSVV